jgi:hypothetical protein
MFNNQSSIFNVRLSCQKTNLMRIVNILLFLLFSTSIVYAQKRSPHVEILTSGTKTSLRGLSVVNDNIVWVSGSNGTVGKTTNGGKNWKWVTVKGFEQIDFRDIEAFDATTAVIMGIGSPAYILRTIDGGDTWKVVYENKRKEMFLDAMEFWNEQTGIVVGDPVDGRFFIARSTDGGNTWKDDPVVNRPVADTGEGCFAASGTNIRALNRDESVFISGGLKSRMFLKDKVITLPIIQGKETTGANSISVYDYFKKNGGTRLIVTGGDFNTDTSTKLNCFYSNNRGKTWHQPKTPPHGYRSCVEFLSKKDIVSCGLNGVDYSFDGGKNWSWISKESFHVVRIAKLGPSIYLAGRDGKVGRLLLE